MILVSAFSPVMQAFLRVLECHNLILRHPTMYIRAHSTLQLLMTSEDTCDAITIVPQCDHFTAHIHKALLLDVSLALDILTVNAMALLMTLL